MTDQQAILIFMTTQAALQAEDALLEAGLDIEVVPKPPGLQGLCGIALALWVSHLAAAEAVLNGESIPYAVYDETLALAYASRSGPDETEVRADPDEIEVRADPDEIEVRAGPDDTQVSAEGGTLAPEPPRVYTPESASSGRMPSQGPEDNRILTPAPAERPGPHESEGGEPN